MPTPVAESRPPISLERPAPNRRTAQQTGASTPSTTPADPSFFEKVFGNKLGGSNEPTSQVLAYANPFMAHEPRARLGAKASAEQMAAVVRANGLPDVTDEDVRQLWDEGHLPAE